MKNLRNLLLVSLLLFTAEGMNAQSSVKFGHIDSNALLSAMPESDSAQAQIQRLSDNYSQQLDEMNVELNKKYNDYINNRDTYTELIRQTKESDLNEMNQRIQNFQQSASEDLQTKQQQLFAPIIDKANKAVREVAEENGFIYIFDVSQGNPIYFSDQSTDILPLVKMKLGL